MRTLLAILLGVRVRWPEAVDTAQLPMSAERKSIFHRHPAVVEAFLPQVPRDKFQERLPDDHRESALKGGELASRSSRRQRQSPSSLNRRLGGGHRDAAGRQGAGVSRGRSAWFGLDRPGCGVVAPTEKVFTAEPMVRYITISGSAEAFRQHWGMTGGLSSGSAK
ncbi:MAG: hypothetical protein CM1200mP29_15850 [Verrucomicrobiota bacterium]|nr:MAG: hypothetical protein CM1200mP29_15850 [Verrucomicrobiota bacterium]